eukprot:6993983-Lingulodinium_polyedra.AAC.1
MEQAAAALEHARRPCRAQPRRRPRHRLQRDPPLLGPPAPKERPTMEARDARPHSSPILRAARWERAGQPK